MQRTAFRQYWGYKRHLVNALRDAFNLHAAPMRIIVKAGKNPFVDES